MDAPDDREVKLQRASGDLVVEFLTKLPSLLWKFSKEQNIRVARRWTAAAKTEKLVALLEPFQEWPQLLDPHLQKLLPPLVDSFLSYLVKHRDQYGVSRSRRQGALYPLPRAICRILYTFCKVRGVKVISRFLNNEPKYLDPLLRAFVEWDAIVQNDPMEVPTTDSQQRLIWEERYVMLTWLSHLLLAPFDLSSMSSDDIPVPHDNLHQLKPLSSLIPTVTKSLLSISLNYVNVPGKEREAATSLLARLALRGDMQPLGLLNNLTDWAFSIIRPQDVRAEPPSEYTCIGVLSFLARLGASGQVDEFAHLVLPTFEQVLHLNQEHSTVSKVIRSSASARKICIKILRAVTIMALSLNERMDGSVSDDQVSSMLEDAIDHFLVSLSDKDTPVRFAASKALSIITLKLDPAMAAEVIEAVTDSLEENILFEKQDGALVTPLEAQNIGIHTLMRSLNAVDAQRWQGLILTLSHLLFRRAPPTHQLPNVLQHLLSGLDFEQRSSTGSSVGTGVRDASCFGIWALSRKYTTQELMALNPQTISAPTNQIQTNVLQMLAIELVCAACVDPSGNIRRGASAALQELVGRHPNTIAEGISLVQVVDYHAVARRSRAMYDVAMMTAGVNHIYWSPLVNALTNWRGIGSPDAESRRHAAKAIGTLSTQGFHSTLSMGFARLLHKLSSLPRNDVETRHGCLLAIAAAVDAYCDQQNEWSHKESSEAFGVSRQITELWEIFGSPSGPTKDDLTLQSWRPELTAEASSRLVHSLSRAVCQTGNSVYCPSDYLLEKALEVLLLCVSRGEDIAIETSSDALSQLFLLLPVSKQEEVIQSWFSHIQATWELPTARGQISALGSVFKQLQPESDLRMSITKTLLDIAEKEELIEKRVSAVRCLANEILPHMAVTDVIANHFVGFLNDYTTDRRGDIGSLIRVEAIQAAATIIDCERGLATHSSHVRNIVGCLCRLAAEKLDKVRLQAWLCLQGFWESANGFPPLQKKYEHFSHVSTPEYFLQLLELYAVDWLRLPLLQGLATSAVAGAEGLVRATRLALVHFINGKLPGARQETLLGVLKELSAILSDNHHDDRYAIPTMEFLAFLIDGYIPSIPEGSEALFRKLFILLQKAHFKSSHIARLEAAIKAYGSLSRLDPLRVDVHKKMIGMLLHPFPRVRSSVADYLYIETNSDMVKFGDWTRQPKQLKGDVESLRTVLLT